MEHIESFFGLCHGTDMSSAQSIVENGFNMSSSENWCGEGIYFYDVESKAWWSAERTCNVIKKKNRLIPRPKKAMVRADIVNIKRLDIFDLRDKRDVEEFAEFVNKYNCYKPRLCGIDSEEETMIKYRALLIGFFAKKNNKKLVIGQFKQSQNSTNYSIIQFTKNLNLVIEVETIYCVKSADILSNVRLERNE